TRDALLFFLRTAQKVMRGKLKNPTSSVTAGLCLTKQVSTTFPVEHRRIRMNCIRRILVPGAVVLGLAWTAMAAEVRGVLMDKMCSMKAMKEGQKAAAMHTRECALMPNCKASGYGVYTSDGKYLKFDAAGDEKASQALASTAKKDNLNVTVTGDIEGDTIKVA